jgi:subtilisin family serine protease
MGTCRFWPSRRAGNTVRASNSRLRFEPLEDRTLLNGEPVAAVQTFGPFTVDLGSYEPSTILVRFRPEAVCDVAACPGLTGPEILPGTEVAPGLPLVTGLRQVHLADGVRVEDALAAYRANPLVLYAEPDYRVRLHLTPNDPQFASQWNLNNTGQTGGTVDADIDAPEAWNVTTGGGQTIVAVIDTGVDYNHPDLAANMWTNSAELNGRPGVDDDGNGYVDDVHGYDFANRDGNPMDDHNHGTHVAGILGAVGNNGVGVTGINWRVRIMALKFLDAQGSGSTSDAILALNYAVANGARISNNSWGGDPFSQALFDAIRNARDAGHIFVTAAGNGNIFGIGQNNDSTPFYPAGYNLNNIIAVAATDHRDNLATFSNYGATTVDLAAPGVSILSTTRNNTYTRLDGTSMAAPHVAGVVALVWDLHPTWTYTQVINHVLSTVDPVSALQGKTVTGGRLNAARAVQPPPVIDLNWSGGGITGPSTADTRTPYTLSRTYTISGEAAATNFTIAYYASSDATFGNADDALVASETISAAADKTVGTHTGTSPALQFLASGTFYLFARLDSANAILETNESNNVAQAPQTVAVTGPVILDNGQPGYTEAGSGWTSWTGGYGGGFRYSAAGTGSNTATWQFTGLTGYYQVQVTWVAEPNRATNAPFRIYDGASLQATARINQQLAPSGTSINGFVFQSLGTFAVASGTLRVVLGNDANAYVIADAVRLVPVPPPIVDLSWSGGGITGPATATSQTPFTISRTYTINGEAAATNFAIAYYASSDATFGNADDVLLGTETVSAAADKTVGTHSGTSPALQFTAGGTYYLFAKVDSTSAILETNESNNVAQAPQPVVVSGPVILDNGQPGYTEVGTGWAGWTGGYGGSYRYSAAGTGSNTATWQQAGLAAGNYQVQATWRAEPNRATNAPYRIYDGTTLLATARINQQLAPSGTTINGFVFQSLGTFAVTSGTLRVVLGNDANNYVIADAVRLVPLPPATMDLNWSGGGITGPATTATQTPFTISRTYTISGGPAASNFAIAYYASSDATFGNADDVLLGTETVSASADKAVGTHSGTSPSLQFTAGGTYYLFAQLDSASAIPETSESNNVAQAPQPVVVSGPILIDNGQPGYTEAGTGWFSWPGGYGGNYRYSAAGTGSNTATWQATGLAAGNYQVQATWRAEPNRATNAPYRIYDGTTLLATVRVNQQLAPSGTSVNGFVFQSLGTFAVTSGTLRVVLGNDANNYVIADAVRAVPAGSGPLSVPPPGGAGDPGPGGSTTGRDRPGLPAGVRGPALVGALPPTAKAPTGADTAGWPPRVSPPASATEGRAWWRVNPSAVDQFFAGRSGQSLDGGSSVSPHKEPALPEEWLEALALSGSV